MILTMTSRSAAEIEQCDWQDALTIQIDGKIVFEVKDGEPENATLNRDFYDCRKILSLLERAFEAGASGEKLAISVLTSDKI